MTRFLAFAGAVALTLAQPVVSPAQPPPRAGAPMFVPVYNAAPPIYHPAPAQPVTPNRRSTQDRSSFKVPFDLNVGPGLLHQPALEPTLQTYRWRGWGSSPAFLWFPTPCSSNGFGPLWGMPATPTDALAPPNVTIGSLVDDQSHGILSSYPSYDAAITSGDAGITSGPVLQYGLQPTRCGAPGFVGI